MRLVLDTDVMVAGLQSPKGASRRLLLGAVDREIELVASVPLFVEWEAVLKRPAVLRAAALTAEDVDVVLDQLAALIVPVELWYLWRPQLVDPDDEMVLETAINGAAEAVVTFNQKHFTVAARFGVAVRLPREIVKELP
jgi:putative PIN family toxin of toxin-antitoxin system